MITPQYCRLMARYNAWQNLSLYTAARGLDDAAREQDRGAFFGSIRGTLSHLLWADLIWTARLDGGTGPKNVPFGPETARAYDWGDLCTLRPQLDARIAAWSWMVTDTELAGDLTWFSAVMQRDLSKPMALCVMHLFNHQTHHRGQVHAMLTAAGARPDDTDLPFMPDEVPEWP